jgi:ribosomal protein L22
VAEPKDKKAKKAEEKGKEAAKSKTPAKAKSAPKAKAEPKKKTETKAKAETKPKKKAAQKPAAKTGAKTAAKTSTKAAKPVTPPSVHAKARYVRVAPRKVRLVADQIRGMPIDDARSLLRFSPRGAAQDLAKLLDSAAANAENNHDLVADDLTISEITVNEGPTLRRFRPRALGRATRIDKRTSHISVALTPGEED